MKNSTNPIERIRARWLNPTLGLCLLSLAGGCADSPAAPDDQPADEASETPGREDTGPVTLRTAEGTREVMIERLGDGTLVFDGDIMISEAELAAARVGGSTRGAVTTVGGTRWTNGIIPYEIDPTLTNQARVTDAIAHWTAHTQFQFVLRTTQTDYVRFVPSADACSSHVGRQGGRQDIFLASGCDKGSTIHEIGHAVGLFHEQTRADRDTYVTIHTSCIETDKAYNFSKYTTGVDVGPYDYNSIMHYGRYAFSTTATCETITPLDSHATIGQRTKLSAGDQLAAARIYSGTRPTVQLVPADYDGDGRTDLAIRDDAGTWRVDYASNGFGNWDVERTGYGDVTCTAVPADYDGDGKADFSVKCANGTWYVDYASSPQDGWNVIRSGYGACTPVPADYDGDGKADFSTKCADGTWYVDYASSPQDGWNVIRGGYGACTPVPADYDGDGKADFSTKCADGTWYVDYAASPQDGWNSIRGGYGDASCTPVPADYDGDGKADYSVKCSSGLWAIDYASSPQDGWNVMVYGYGNANAVPTPGNYDGVDPDGKRRVDLSVKDIGQAGTWYIDYAANGFGAWDVFNPTGV